MGIVSVLGIGIIGVAANMADRVEAFRSARTGTYWAGIIVSFEARVWLCRSPFLFRCNTEFSRDAWNRLDQTPCRPAL